MPPLTTGVVGAGAGRGGSADWLVHRCYVGKGPVKAGGRARRGALGIRKKRDLTLFLGKYRQKKPHRKMRFVEKVKSTIGE